LEARKIKAPVLVLHGKDDTLVVPEVGRSLAEALQKRGSPVELNLYSGGHHYYPVSELIKFFDKHLKAVGVNKDEGRGGWRV
jgi:dipeptidyl aminopeptidase/acylaminoacyl peptidase